MQEGDDARDAVGCLPTVGEYTNLIGREKGCPGLETLDGNKVESVTRYLDHSIRAVIRKPNPERLELGCRVHELVGGKSRRVRPLIVGELERIVAHAPSIGEQFA